MHSFDEGLVIYPRGQEMDGGAIKGNSVEWVSKYASVVSNLVPYLEKYMGEGKRLFIFCRTYLVSGLKCSDLKGLLLINRRDL